MTVDQLVVATTDSNWKVRWDAVNELGLRKEPLGIPALAERALRDDNPHPRWRSLWALAAVGQPELETVPLLLAGLEDPDPIVVRNAAVALAFFDQSEARPELLSGLEDADDWRRWEAVFSLKKVANDEVINALILLLNADAEPDVRVRQEVALALGSIGGQLAIQPLLDALREDASGQVRWRAALSLGKLGDASTVDELEAALAQETDSQVIEFIEKAIEELSAR